MSSTPGLSDMTPSMFCTHELHVMPCTATTAVAASGPVLLLLRAVAATVAVLVLALAPADFTLDSNPICIIGDVDGWVGGLGWWVVGVGVGARLGVYVGGLGVRAKLVGILAQCSDKGKEEKKQGVAVKMPTHIVGLKLHRIAPGLGKK